MFLYAIFNNKKNKGAKTVVVRVVSRAACIQP